MKTLFFLFSLMVFGVHSLHASPVTCSQLIESSPALDSVYKKLFKRKGLRVQSLSFYLSGSEGPFLELAVYYQGKLAGGIILTDLANDDFEEGIDDQRSIVMPDLVHLAERFRGTGLGSFLYLVAAKLAYENTKLVLYDSWDQTAEATRLWESLVKRGFVMDRRKVKSNSDLAHHYSFEASVLSSPLLSPLVNWVLKKRRKTGPDNLDEALDPDEIEDLWDE